MSKLSAQQIISNLRHFFTTGITRDIQYRKTQLKKLKEAIQSHENEILKALHDDLGKSSFESYASEIGILYSEIDFTLRHLSSWAKPERVPTSLLHFFSTSKVYHIPYGTTLIIGPWNYPLYLVIAPLISAIAAGNCILIKPSELAPSTSSCITTIINRTFNPDYITVIEGGIDITRKILKHRFDYIFFTGSTEVGRHIMRAAAEHLTPVTLELGGKSPVIVTSDANLMYAAKRIAWGKFFNAGQTCLAPDYILAETSIKQELLHTLQSVIHSFYGDAPEISSDFARIINDKHFKRLSRLLKSGDIAYGGATIPREKYIAPTILDNVSMEDPVMQEEIFGPILPVIDIETVDEAVTIINSLPRPLALYIFTGNKKTARHILNSTHSGGGCINDTISHVASNHLPFGGIGESGMGNYHGKNGFIAFSHQRSILSRTTMFDMPLRYPPYGNKISLLKKIFRFF